MTTLELYLIKSDPVYNNFGLIKSFNHLAFEIGIHNILWNSSYLNGVPYIVLSRSSSSLFTLSMNDLFHHLTSNVYTEEHKFNEICFE